MAKQTKNNNEKRERENDREEQIIEKLVNVRRVTKVVKGGKTMRFSKRGKG